MQTKQSTNLSHWGIDCNTIFWQKSEKIRKKNFGNPFLNPIGFAFCKLQTKLVDVTANKMCKVTASNDKVTEDISIISLNRELEFKLVLRILNSNERKQS